MYKSPIEIISSGFKLQVEDDIYKAVETYGITIDKDELLKALSYDREQYRYGYSDGYSDGLRHLRELLKDYTKFLIDELGIMPGDDRYDLYICENDVLEVRDKYLMTRSENIENNPSIDN